MKPWALLFILVCFATLSRGAEATKYSLDEDVRSLCGVKMFSFDIIGMMGISKGEVVLSRILKKDDRLKYLFEVYNRGTPESKVYALAALHYLAPDVFKICWKDCVGKYNPIIHSMDGCISGEGTLLEFFTRIQAGQYDPYIKKYTGG
jgi:hypothetical protein